MGGALVRTFTPTPPKTAKDITSTTPKAIHSFLWAILKHLPKGKFAQVAAHLCRNAVHYARAGGGHLAKLPIRFTANTVTAVISATAEMGSHDHAE